MSKVYVVNSSGHDLSGAEEFGELIPLTQGRINIYSTDRLLLELREKLKHYEEGDYLLLCGYILLNLLAGGIILEKTGKLNLLLYDFRTKKYLRREVILWGVSKKD